MEVIEGKEPYKPDYFVYPYALVRKQDQRFFNTPCGVYTYNAWKFLKFISSFFENSGLSVTPFADNPSHFTSTSAMYKKWLENNTPILIPMTNHPSIEKRVFRVELNKYLSIMLFITDEDETYFNFLMCYDQDELVKVIQNKDKQGEIECLECTTITFKNFTEIVGELDDEAESRIYVLYATGVHEEMMRLEKEEKRNKFSVIC